MSQIVKTLVDLVPRDGSAATNATKPLPANLHGVLGDWAVVGYGINVCSIVLSVIVILATIVLVFRNRSLIARPSMRISTSIAACDVIYSVCQMFIFNNDYMTKLSETRLRVMLWIMSGSSVSFVFLSSCMGIQLLLTVLTRNSHWATVIQPYYEVSSFFLAFLITHPYLYIFEAVMWIPSAQVYYLKDADVSTSRRNLWLIQWMWIFMGIVFLFFVAVFTYLKMSQVWREASATHGAPEKLDLLDTATLNALSEERKKYIRSVTLRVTCYPIIPILTQTLLVVGNLLAAPPYWLFVLSNVLPSTQGTLNFIVYCMNPALDVYRKSLMTRLRGTRKKREENFGKLSDTESTRHLPSPSLPSSAYSAQKDDYAYV
ncbi:hypothetical protein GGI21_004128 [Coemansia aciculifera]|uniref:Uncharacterized protein n=1 Tax=Coemansia aciculifera TaxID=417176 RepID=A0ACC1MAY9_9FUNG|nr:hypothetical protein IWW38_000425 [Coemansia aciculifera]KAJ2905795.1 hypothetical protein GGI21_004128 [Coemansia aciculifera]